jgi:nitrate/TMAO reductase-like tetraheme cytochrome c subunit
MDSNNCHCCGKEILDKRSTYIDHCHETNKIRGILCMSCNSGIGFLGDNLEGVLKAVEYLTNNKQLKL